MTLRALACPASLKGAPRRPQAARRSRGASRRSASTPTSCRSPTAARGRSTRCATRSRPTPPSTRSAGRDRARGRARATARTSSRRRRRSRSTRDPLDVLAASSRGLGTADRRSYPDWPLVVAVGGTATMDGGAGMLEVLDRLPGPTARALRRARPASHDAPRLFGPQKGASPEQVAELEARLAAMPALAPYAELPGAGAAGGLGAALGVARGGARAGRRGRARPARRSTRRPTTSCVTGEGAVDAHDLGGEGAVPPSPALLPSAGVPLRRLRRPRALQGQSRTG